MTDYKQIVIDCFATEIAVTNVGIYPKAYNDKKRTEYQEGWNACIMSISKNTCAVATYLREVNMPELFDYCMDEVVFIAINEDSEISLSVNCSDLFYWACGDQEVITLEQLPDLAEALKESPKNGSILWCCRQRNMRPQKPYYKYFSDEETVLFDACGPERDDA